MVRVKPSVNILVVDDDQQLADMLNEYLSRHGFAVTTVYGGREALTAFSSGNFPIVIVDLNMPEVDGMAVLEHVRRTDRTAVAIMITGYGVIDSAVAAINRGAYDYIAKPFKLEELEVVLQRAIQRHRTLKQLALDRKLIWVMAALILIFVGIVLFRFLK